VYLLQAAFLSLQDEHDSILLFLGLGMSTNTLLESHRAVSKNRPASPDAVDTGESSTGSSAPVDSADKLLDELETLSDGEQNEVSLGEVMDAIGRKSFAPVLLAIGIVMLTPGVPVILGCIVVIVASQMIFGRQRLWIPKWLEERHVRRSKVQTAVRYARTPAKWMDAMLTNRMEYLVQHNGRKLTAVLIMVVGLSTPLLEFIPFSAHVAGAIISTLALAMVAGDGLIAAVAMILSAVGIGSIVYASLT
jgi:hypothetical protein